MPTQIEEFDIAEYFTEPLARAELISDALESGDAGYLAHAIGIVARAHGMSRLSRETGLPRGSLYKALQKEGNPTLSTLLRVLDACGLKLKAVPDAEQSEAA